VEPRNGLKIGCADDNFIYLIPVTAFALADRLARDAGTVLAATSASLGEALKAKGWLVPETSKTGERLQARIRSEQKQVRVWKVRHEALAESSN